MRVGIVGAGRMGSWHARNLAALDDVIDPILIHDVDHSTAARLAGQVDGVATRSADELLAEVDAVVLASPAAHREHVFRQAVSAGLAVFCEKPLASTLAEARLFAQLVENARNHRVQIGFQRRCDPEYRSIRDRVRSGDLGRLLAIRCTAYDHMPPPAGYEQSADGIFSDCLIHDIDGVHWLTGLRTVAVQAVESALPTGGPEKYCTVATAVLALSDGSNAVLTASRLNPHGYDHRTELLGTRDSLALGLGDRTPLRSSITRGPGTPELPVFTDFTDRFATAYVEEMRAFMDLVVGRASSVCTPSEALLAQEVAAAAAAAAATGSRVVLGGCPAPLSVAGSSTHREIGQV